VIIKVGDNITTDEIMPAGSKVLPFRSNIPAISEFVFAQIDSTFSKRALAQKMGIVVGGENYGQGSSREHAAIAPRYLGIRAKLAKSFARIHKANLINFGILPLIFVNSGDYDLIQQGDQIRLPSVKKILEQGESDLVAEILTSGKTIPLRIEITERERKILIAGGLINLAGQ